MVIAQWSISLQLKNGQFEGLLITVISEFKDPLKGLNLVKIMLQVETIIKFSEPQLWDPEGHPLDSLFILVFLPHHQSLHGRKSIRCQEDKHALKWASSFALLLCKSPTYLKGLLRRNAGGWEASPLLALLVICEVKEGKGWKDLKKLSKNRDHRVWR